MDTGLDNKLRSRVAGMDETWYNYAVGYNVVSEEDDADGSTGTLTTTIVLRTPYAAAGGSLADIAGASPTIGTPRYYTADHLGSTRGAYGSTKTALGVYEYSPYGDEYVFTGNTLDTLSAAFTGKPWDDDSKLYHFPFRDYSAERGRWVTQDPLGMVDGPNMYAYVGGGPTMSQDLLGLRIWANPPQYHTCECLEWKYYWDLYSYEDEDDCWFGLQDRLKIDGGVLLEHLKSQAFDEHADRADMIESTETVLDFAIFFAEFLVGEAAERRMDQRGWGKNRKNTVGIIAGSLLLFRLNEIEDDREEYVRYLRSYRTNPFQGTVTTRRVEKEFKSLCKERTCRRLETYPGCSSVGQTVPIPGSGTVF